MADTVTVRVPLVIRKRGGRKVVVSPDGSVLPTAQRHVATNADPALLKALGRAFRWKRLLDDGTYASVSDIARAEKLDRTYVGDVLRLTLLAPEVVEAIVDGRQPGIITLPALLRPWPLEWPKLASDGNHKIKIAAASTPKPAMRNSKAAGPPAMVPCRITSALRHVITHFAGCAAERGGAAEDEQRIFRERPLASNAERSTRSPSAPK